jgi:hypothetical protein
VLISHDQHPDNLACGAPLTLTSELAAEAVEVLGQPATVPLH